jgi:hypothetical protein
MSTAIEYERLKTSIVDFNLSISEEPTPGVRSGNSPSGFLAECYLGPRDSQNGLLNNNWHVHYRE